MMAQCILLLGANQFQRERALIGAETATDACVVTVSSNSPYHNNKYPAFTIRSEETNPDQLLRDVVDFTNKSKMQLLGVIPLNDFVLNAGFAVAQYFNLPYNEKSTIENGRHKDKMKAVLAKANLPVITSFKFSNDHEAVLLADKIGYPLVIKPLNFGGSGGVKKVTSCDELKVALAETRNHLEQHASHYDSDAVHMVIEPYIVRDREISVEVINTPNFRQVIGITDKYLGAEPYFSEIAHLVPSTFYKCPDLVRVIEKLALDACRALNIKFGMAHVEIKLFQDGSSPVIIEVGARTAGDGIMDLYEKATGQNIYKLHCQAYLGSLNREMLPKNFLRTAAIGYLHPKSGVVAEIDTHALNADDLVDVDLITIKAQPGQEITLAKNWSTRYGFIEYTFWDNLPENFNLVARTNQLTDKLFQIK